jgi:sulfide:quinone oxidoreductase
VVELNPNRKELLLANGDRMGYDFLIIATGPRLAFEEIPGTGPGKNSVSVCTTPHASEAAEAIDVLLENPGPVVVGAVQGSSCFGPAYEFALLLHHELGKRGGVALQKKCPITFVTSEPYIGHLGLKGAGDSRKILEKLFTKKGIEWISNCKVQNVSKESVSVEYLEDKGDGTYTKRLKTLPSKFNMLIPAFRGMDIWKSVPGLTDKNGMIHLNEYQQSVQYPDIFAVGVAVHLDTVDVTPIPTGAPKTGYMIESMGTAAVKNIRSILEYQKKHSGAEYPELHEKASLHGLCITDFGNHGAIFLTLPQLPPRRTEITIDGKVATLAKIAFEKYFLHKIESGDTDPYYEKYLLRLIGVDRTEKD